MGLSRRLKDILDDIRLLHRQRTASEPPFGRRLRCSGCHVNGGLLQKELAAPHNDWHLEARHLPLGSLKPDPAVKETFRGRRCRRAFGAGHGIAPASGR